jgi:aromatic amino acid transport protein AroP
MFLITVVLFLTPEVRISVYAMPFWVAVVYGAFIVRKGAARRHRGVAGSSA